MAKRWHVLPSEIMKCSPEEMALNFFVLDKAATREEETAKRYGKDAMPVYIVGGM